MLATDVAHVLARIVAAGGRSVKRRGIVGNPPLQVVRTLDPVSVVKNHHLVWWRTSNQNKNKQLTNTTGSTFKK